MALLSPISSRELRLRVVLLVGSLAVCLLFLEGAVRLLGLAPSPVDPGDRSGGFTFFAPDPRLGWTLVPGARDRHASPEFEVTIEITSQGLRESRVYAERPPVATERVVVVGDSFTFGHGVEEPEGWAARLEARSRTPLEVINLAVTGFGLDQQVLRLESEGLAFHPHRILVGLFLGDVFRTAQSDYMGYAKPWFELVDGRLELRGVPVPDRPPPPGILRRLALGRLVLGRGRDLMEHLGFGVAWDRTDALLRRLAALGERTGADVRIVVIPKDRAVLGTGLRRRIHERALDRLAETIRDAGLGLVDTTGPLREAAAGGELLYYPLDGHWTPAAHRVAAEEVARALEIPFGPGGSDPG